MTITLRVPRAAIAAILGVVLVLLGHARAAVPLAGPVPVPLLLLAAGLVLAAVAAAVAVWLVMAGRPSPGWVNA